MESMRLNGFVLVVGVILLLAGWAIYIFDWDPFGIRLQPPPEEPPWWYRTVVVTNEEGGIHATPDPLLMSREDKVRWENPSGLDFQIEFENTEYPFAEWKMPAERANRYQRPKSDTPLDAYKYSLIFGTDTLDPIIKVEEDPPPGGDSASATP